MGIINHDELNSQEAKISFTISEDNKKHEKKITEIKPSPVRSEETHLRQNESNTVADLSTLQS